MRHSHFVFLVALASACLAQGVGAQNPGNGPASDPRERTVLKVFDGKGRYVGPLVAAGGAEVATVIVANHATVVVPISRTYVNDAFSATQYEWGASLDSTPYYTTPDCSGPPYISGATPVRPSVTLRTGTTATAYIAADVASSTVTVQSYGQPGGCTTLGANSSVPPATTAEGWAPESTYSLTKHYPEPLTVHY